MLSDLIKNLIDGVIGVEGGYSNNPADRGGPTRWGVTEAVARKNGYTGDMRALPRAIAFDIFLREYVLQPGFDRIAALDARIGAELVDTGVNMGQSVASAILQRILNAFNQQGGDYPDLKVDGALGDVSIRAFTSYRAKRGEEGMVVLLAALNSLQGDRYIDLCERRPANEAFAYGWFKNRVCNPDDFHPLKGAR